MPKPSSYGDILQRGFVPGGDFRIAFGGSNIERCLLVAPHGGGIEPGTSEIMRMVADTGHLAWYEFAGFLRQGNKEALHIPSSYFDEPTFLNLLTRTAFAVTFHGCNNAGEPRVYIGGLWGPGRAAIVASMNTTVREHGIRAVDAIGTAAPGHLRGGDASNLANRGMLRKGIQLEFSREARNLLFPPDASREARGRTSAALRSLARSINAGIDAAAQQLGQAATGSP